MHTFSASTEVGIRRAGLLCLCAVAALLAAGCAAPVGVKHVGPKAVHRELTGNVLSTGKPSGPTRILLRQHHLEDLFDDDPAAALADLHGKFARGEAGSDELFALAELSFLHAEEGDARPYFLASAVYAFAFVFPDDPTERVHPVDPRLRVACDLYNRALTEGFASADHEHVELRAGSYALPFGTLQVGFDESSLLWAGRRLSDFVPAAEFEVQGLRNRYRRAGIGAPLAARPHLIGEQPQDDFVGAGLRVAASAILRIEEPRRQLGETTVHAELELYAADEAEAVEIDGLAVPLEFEPSAALATALTESQYWKRELRGFFGDLLSVRESSWLRAREPYRQGRIPVAFVHGTGSSPARWADMVNDLDADPVIRRHFQFWFFRYDSGNPIGYSAMLLRRALIEAEGRFNPDGEDPCLDQVVVIGHSQGGLLTKMTAIDSGNSFWENLSSTPFDEVDLSPDSRDLIREALFIEPLPFVERLIFVSTPHRGSFLAGPQFVRRLAARFIRIPSDVVNVSTDLVGLHEGTSSYLSLGRMSTSIDNMAPGHPFIETLASIPVSPDVRAHSIIPVKGDGPLEDEDDGVVRYSSAHIDEVESELVVYGSGHSTQSDPRTVGEVRRILHLHLEQSGCAEEPQTVGAPAD
jgi:pimeloyl-ACP methyl ester carboxylesterase